MTTTLPSLADIYSGAARILRTLGWVQEVFVADIYPPERPTEECPVCLIEAIFRAAGLPPKTWPDGTDDSEDQVARWKLAEAAAEALATRLGYDLDKTPDLDKPDRAFWLIGWNDREERTLAEVLAALDEAALDEAALDEAALDEAALDEAAREAADAQASAPAEEQGNHPTNPEGEPR